MRQRFEPAVPIDLLTEHPDNPRQGDEEAILASISAHGFFGAVLVQESTNRIIVGNHRTRVARQAGHDTVPVLYLDVDDEQAQRIMLVENRTNDRAGYATDVLADLLSSLSESDAGLTGTGFGETELADLLAALSPPSVDDLDGQHGEFDPAGLWPVLRFKVPPPLRDRYLKLVEGRSGGDAELFGHLLELAER